MDARRKVFRPPSGKRRPRPSWYDIEFDPGEVTLLMHRQDVYFNVEALRMLSVRLKELIHSWYHADVHSDRLEVITCSVEYGAPKHWGLMVEIHYRIASQPGWYRHVFHLMLKEGGLSGQLFTQTRRHYAK